MSTLRHLVCASLTTGLFLTAGTAEARFGKRSDSSSSSEKKEEKHEERKHAATPVNSSSGSGGSSGGSGSSYSSSSSSSRRHEASPVGWSSSGSGSSYSDNDTSSGYATTSYSGSSSVTVISVSDDHPPVYPYTHTPELDGQAVAEHRSPILVRMGLTGQAMGGGSALGLNLGLEGKRWGVDGALTAMSLPTDDGTAGEDKLGLYSTHLTYALLSSDEGRLRAEAGVAMATAPDITFVGPSIALSFERCLFGGLDVEGRGQLVAVPYTQLDAQAGLGLHLGILTLRGGWRWLLLNDHGLVDGEAHEDIFAGPYAGLGLNF